MTTQAQQDWISIRLAVSAALIIGSMIFYFGYWVAMWAKQQKKAYIYMNEVASKFYLFGLGALLSLNYYQAGIYQAIMAYLTLVSLILLVGAALMPENVDDQKRSVVYIVYYLFLFAWYMGIMIDLYVTWNFYD